MVKRRLKFISLRRGLIGLAAGVLIALLFLPQTEWLVRRQVLAILLAHPIECPMCYEHTSQTQIDEVFAHYPNDEQIQYFNVTYTYPDQQSQINGRRALESRFPDNTSLRANILRNCVKRNVFLDRFETVMFMQLPMVYKDAADKHQQNTPQQLKAYDQDAAVGERLDPNNAYFPFMRAIGLYAAHQDTEAQAALLRASHATVWHEYDNDEIVGDWRIQELANGKSSAFVHAAIISSTLNPHYQSLRQVACIATYQAMQLEKTGHVPSGLAIRMALLHIAGLMRAQSTTLMGSRAGMTLAGIALQRPGGARYVPREQLEEPSFVSNFCKYARQHDAPQVALHAQAESAADTQARAVLSKEIGFDTPADGAPISTYLFRLACWWAADMLMMIVIIWLFAFYIIASLLARTRIVREAQPLPKWLSRGIAFGFFVITLPIPISFAKSLIDNIILYSDGIIFIVLALILVALIASILLIVKYGKKILVRPTFVVIGVAVLIAASAAGIFEIATRQWHQVGRYLSSFASLSQEGNYFDQLVAFSWITLFVMIATLIVGAIAGRIQRVPIFIGLVRVITRWPLPLTCMAVIIYSAMAVATQRYEEKANTVLTESMQGEGAYIARMTGQTWPGPVK